jgi:glycine cleavage system aminomethyltransferase T
MADGSMFGASVAVTVVDTSMATVETSLEVVVRGRPLEVTVRGRSPVVVLRLTMHERYVCQQYWWER